MNRFLAAVYAIAAAVILIVAVFIAFEESGLLPSAFFTFLASVIAYTSWKRWHKPDHAEAVANQWFYVHSQGRPARNSICCYSPPLEGLLTHWRIKVGE